jgi:hypothetical protein
VNHCAEFEDMLDELALGVLPGDQRVEAIAHVEGCPRCRSVVDDLSRTADDILAAIPSREPPLDFCAAVMERVHPSPRRSRRRPRWGVVAAAAVAGAVLVAGGYAAGGRLGGDTDELRTVALVAAQGGRVGDATTYPSPRWYFLRVDQGLPDGAYQCVIDTENGRALNVGSLVVAGGRGAWGGEFSPDPGRLRTARLVDAAGVTVATARLP